MKSGPVSLIEKTPAASEPTVDDRVSAQNGGRFATAGAGAVELDWSDPGQPESSASRLVMWISNATHSVVHSYPVVEGGVC